MIGIRLRNIFYDACKRRCYQNPMWKSEVGDKRKNTKWRKGKTLRVKHARALPELAHTPHRRGLPHTRRDSLSTSLSRSLPERCWCVSMMPATPPPPLPSAAITARRRAAAGQLVALAGDDAAILQSWLRLPAMMQSGLLARQSHPTVAGELPGMRLLTSRHGFFKMVLVGMMSLLRRGSLRCVYCIVW